MKALIFLLICTLPMTTQMIYDFNESSPLKGWYVVDDVVMGGRSAGSLFVNAEGHGVFKGYVSLENNGGFSSIRHRFKRMSVEGFTKVKLKVKGDGKKYQFRVKSSSRDYYSYVATFSTTGEWQDIEIPLESMYPAFRGRQLKLSNFDQSTIEEIAILIGNKEEESFELLIDQIELQ